MADSSKPLSQGGPIVPLIGHAASYPYPVVPLPIASLQPESDKHITLRIQQLETTHRQLQEAARKVLAAWDEHSGLLTTHYGLRGKQIIEALRSAI